MLDHAASAAGGPGLHAGRFAGGGDERQASQDDINEEAVHCQTR